MRKKITLGDAVAAGIVMALETRQRLLEAGFEDADTAPWPGAMCIPSKILSLSKKDIERGREVADRYVTGRIRRVEEGD